MGQGGEQLAKSREGKMPLTKTRGPDEEAETKQQQQRPFNMKHVVDVCSGREGNIQPAEMTGF